MRALTIEMDQWVTYGSAPPTNRIATRASGTLVPLLPQSGMGFPNIPGVFYNGIMRIRLPGISVPKVDGCDASGQCIPLLETQAERIAAGDPRLSIQERYSDHATYVNAVTLAAQKLQAEGLMLAGVGFRAAFAAWNPTEPL